MDEVGASESMGPLSDGMSDVASDGCQMGQMKLGLTEHEFLDE